MGGSTLFISAGDPSGDNACAKLVESLRTMNSRVRLAGLGGPRLRALGQEQLTEPANLAVLGFWEVVKRYRFFRNLMERAVQTIAQQKPACLLLVDYPGFNLRLAHRVRRFNIPIVYYISPQVWAWGHRRVKQIKELVDQLIVILPFEEGFYRQLGMKAEFVGHYLLEDIPEEYIASPIPRRNQVALLPGSRPQEVERMLVPLLDAAARFNRVNRTRAVVAAMRNGFDYEHVVEPYAKDSIRTEYDRAREIVYASDLAVVASGTATLETGLIGRPMIVVYKTGRITYAIARKLIKVDHIGLVNLVLGERVVPEMIQEEVTGHRLHEAMSELWSDQNRYEGIRARLNRLPELLQGRGASERAAAIVSQYL